MRFADDAVSFPTRDGGRGSQFTASLSEAEFATQSLRILLSQLGAATFTPIAPHFRHLDEQAHDRWGNEITLVDMTNDYSVRFDRILTEGELHLLRRDAGVEFARPVVPGRFFFSPNDEYFDEQWGLENVGQIQSVILCDGIAVPVPDFDANATEAWDDVLVPGCKIGVLDTGIYDQHEDLETSVDHNLSDEGDNCGHGTAVCGVIAAGGDNGVGVAGIARPDIDESEDMLVVFKTEDECNTSSQLANSGMALFANDSGYSDIGVVNESWGTYVSQWDYDPADRDARRNAYVKGLFLVAAAGNDPCGWSADSCFAYPAGFNNFVTAVSALAQDGTNPEPAFAYTDLVAAANNIVTTWIGDGESHDDYMGVDTFTPCGTSVAAPLVSGAAAMLLGANSILTNDDLRAVLLKTTEDLGAPGRDHVFGHGQLRLDQAIDYVSSPNKVYHASTASFAATSLGFRTQSFANTPFNGTVDNFQNFYVQVFRLTITASFSAKGMNETVIDAWGRPRISTGFPNDSKIDARLLTSYIEPDLSTLGANSITMYTYTYKVFASQGGACLGWFPLAVPGQGVCGSSAQLPKFDYTFITEPSTMANGPVGDDLSVRASYHRGRDAVRIEAVGSVGGSELSVRLLDVTGRVVARDFIRGDRATWLAARNAPSGVYWVVVVSPRGERVARVAITK